MLGLVVGVFSLAKKLYWSKAVIVTLVVLIITTALFDSLIIAAGIVAYDTTKILGWYIGRAPIEDFAYAIFAGIAMPTLWHLVKRKNVDG